MISKITLASGSLLLFCVFAETGRELGFKLASDSKAASAPLLAGVLMSPFLWIAIVLGAAEFFAWFLVLQSTPLNIAYPLISIAYVGVPAVGALFLKERMSVRQLVGVVLITFGVGCVGLSGL